MNLRSEFQNNHEDYIIMSLLYICRVKEAQKSPLKIVDVDGSYLYRKYQRLLSEGSTVSPPGLPSTPLSGWEHVGEDNLATMAKKMPCVTPGMYWHFTAVS